MESQLLATKLRIPPQPQYAVQRTGLVDAIERGIPHYKLMLVSAPAGYGKTTLLSQWTQLSRFKVVWLSVGPEDNDIERFFRYLLAGWEQVQPDVGASPLGILLGSMMPDREAVLSAFINVAVAQPDHTVVILDDFHLIEDEAVLRALTFLLDHLPPTYHFVLAGRGEPALPLARYRARQQLLDISVEDLQVSVDEACEFLTDRMGLNLTNDQIVPLHTQLEGWIAGLQLAALALRRRRDGVRELLVSGRHRFIADYLKGDVLVHLPEDVQQFMLQTSILDRMSAPLCEAVTGQHDAQQMLEHLERDNLFIVPLDDSREWYRYHRIFADFLHEELNRHHPDDIVALHRRAAGWYLDHDLPEHAFEHAVAGEDLQLTIRICERYFFVKLHDGEFNVLDGWLSALPAEWYAAYPTFGLTRAGLLAFTGALDACVRCVDEAERNVAPLEPEDARWQMARVVAFRCFVACFQNDLPLAEMHAERALRDLPAEDLSFRADTYHALGDVYRRNGRWDEARACYLKVLDFAETPSFRVLSADVHGALADLDVRRGRLRDAEMHWNRALAAIQERENWGRIPLPASGWIHLRLGELLYERNQLPEAWEHLSRGLERAELGGDVRSILAGYLMSARLRLTDGNVDAAAEHLALARPLAEDAPYPEWTSRFDRLQLELWLVQNRLRSAADWSDRVLQDGALEHQPESEVARLAVARILIVKDNVPSLQRAMTLLDGLYLAAESEGRLGIQIEALVLQAMTHWRRGEPARAMTSLERALRLAESEGYVRLFADLGLPLARLLQEARSREVMPDYVGRLLTAFGVDSESAGGSGSAVPEPLTLRESEILELIAAGLTNQEIADRLFVSPQTVKKHTGNVYSKLGVHSRTAAAARARELDLLA